MQPNSDSFKNVLSKFATGITVVTTRDANNDFHGITINSFNSVSLEPLLILFSLTKSSHIHQILLESKNFTINILAKDQQAISTSFSKPSALEWQGINHNISSHNNCPIINGSLASLDCRIFNLTEAGDHTIIIGEVVNLDIYQNEEPLIYFGRNYYHLGQKIEQVK